MSSEKHIKLILFILTIMSIFIILHGEIDWDLTCPIYESSTGIMLRKLGQCKARPFKFHRVCLFVCFFLSLFQCPNT